MQGGFICLSVMADYLIGWWKESSQGFFSSGFILSQCIFHVCPFTLPPTVKISTIRLFLCPRCLICTIECWYVRHLKTHQDVFYCLFVCFPAQVLVCGKLRQRIPTTRSWVVAQNLRSKNTVNINIKPAAAIFSPQTDDFHFHTLQWCPACLYNWPQRACSSTRMKTKSLSTSTLGAWRVLDLMGLNQMIQKLK